MPLRSAARFAGTARPLLCLSLTEPSLGACLDQARAYRHLVDLVELRVDLLHQGQWAGVARFATECPLPAMCTIRRTRDGGRWTAPEAVRRRLLTTAAGARFRYLDLESDLPAGAVPLPRRGPRVIRSLHDTAGTPPHLPALLRALPRNGREIPKLAVTPHGCADLARIVAAAQAAPPPHVVIGMGPYGVATRLLAAKLGSGLTFTSAGGRVAAPGHLDPYTMQHGYRFGAIGAATPVYGLIGNPVAHSRSPEIHNRGLAVAGVPGVYVPFLVDEVDRFLDLAPSLGVRGLSVTIPHKETVMALLHRADRSVSGAGACNTVVLEQGRRIGYNTDAACFMEPMAGLLAGGGIRRATVIGAGGAARAIVWALREAGIDVLIANRTLPRAQALAAEMSAAAVALTAPDLAQRVSHYPDLIVQATSIGMERHGTEARAPLRDPIARVPLSGREIVYDIVYAPPETPLLERARAAGCTIVFGHEMLLGQAYEQFRLFTGVPYPSVERSRLSTLLGPD